MAPRGGRASWAFRRVVRESNASAGGQRRQAQTLRFRASPVVADGGKRCDGRGHKPRQEVIAVCSWRLCQRSPRSIEWLVGQHPKHTGPCNSSSKSACFNRARAPLRTAARRAPAAFRRERRGNPPRARVRAAPRTKAKGPGRRHSSTLARAMLYGAHAHGLWTEPMMWSMSRSLLGRSDRDVSRYSSKMSSAI